MAVELLSVSPTPSRDMDVFGKELRLSEADRKLLSGAGEIFLCKTLQVETHSKKGFSSETRYLVISSTRCFILIQNPTSKLEASFNFLTIQQLQCSEQKLTFHLSGESRPREFLSSRRDSVEVISLITAQLKNIFPRTSLEVFLKLTFDPDSLRNDVARLRDDLMNTMDKMDPSTIQSLITSYGFLCDLFSVDYKSEVAWYLNNVYLGHGLREIKLSDFDHLTTKELLPLISSLRHNDFFEGVIEQDGKLTSDVVEELSYVLNSSPSIKTLVLSNCGLKPDSVSRLAVSIKNNPRVSLTRLNLSENHLDEKAIEALGSALESLPHGLNKLRLANCKISAKGASVLAHSMKENKQMQYSLVDFDLSANPLGPDPLGGLSFLQEPHTISTLNLSNCNLVLETVVPILNRGCTQHLCDLNLSLNVGKGKKVIHGNSVASGLKQFCSSSISIRSLNLSGCKLLNSIVTSLLEGLSVNPNINSVKLNISSNDLGSQGVLDMISLIGSTHCLHQLNISDSGLDHNMSDLIAAISENKKLRHLMIGRNFSGKSSVRCVVVQQLASLLQKEDCQLLSLCLDDSHLKEHTPIVLEALADNTSLVKINISGNQMGSRGARCLAKALLCNSSLIEVCLDHNEIPLRGFQEIAASMEHNYTIRVMPIPCYDIGRVGKGVEDHMQMIQRYLCRNHSDERLKVEIAARHRTRLLTATQQSSVVGRELVQLEDLLQWAKVNIPSHELVVEGSMVKDLANNAIKLTDGLYSPQVESDQFQIITAQVKKVLEEFMEKLFVEHIKAKSESMINKSINICKSLLSEETKEKLLGLAVSDKSREFSQAKRDVLRHALPEIVNHVSDSNVEVAANIAELVVEHILTSLERINHKLFKLQKEGRAQTQQDTPNTKVSRNFTFRVQEDSSPTKRKKRVRRADKDDGDDIDGDEVDLPSGPLESGGPALQHLGKSRPKPARLQRGRPSKKPQPTESSAPPPADDSTHSIPTASTPPLQPKVAIKPSPLLMEKKKKQTSEESKEKAEVEDDDFEQIEGASARKEEKTGNDKKEIEVSNQNEDDVENKKNKESNIVSTEEVKKENSTEEVKEDSSTEEVKEKSGIEEVKEKSSTEEVKEKSGIEEVKEKSSTEEVKEKSGIEEVKEKSSTEEVKEKSSTEEVKEESNKGIKEGVKEESDIGTEEVNVVEEKREAIIEDVEDGAVKSGGDLSTSEVDYEEHRSILQEVENNTSSDDVADVSSSSPSQDANKSTTILKSPDHHVDKTEAVRSTDMNAIVSNLEDVLRIKEHGTDEATPPISTPEKPKEECSPKHVTEDGEADTKGSSIKSKGSKKRSGLSKLFKRTRDVSPDVVDTTTNQSRDSPSGEWEVIETSTAPKDSPSPELIKKPPPAVKEKPKAKPHSSENDVEGCKKVPPIVASTQMSSLANVLQHGVFKKMDPENSETEVSRPSKNAPSPAPKPRPSADKVKSSNEVVKTGEHVKASPSPAPKPKPKPSIRKKKANGDEFPTNKPAESNKNEDLNTLV